MCFCVFERRCVCVCICGMEWRGVREGRSRVYACMRRRTRLRACQYDVPHPLRPPRPPPPNTPVSTHAPPPSPSSLLIIRQEMISCQRIRPETVPVQTGERTLLEQFIARNTHQLTIAHQRPRDHCVLVGCTPLFSARFSRGHCFLSEGHVIFSKTGRRVCICCRQSKRAVKPSLFFWGGAPLSQRLIHLLNDSVGLGE